MLPLFVGAGLLVQGMSWRGSRSGAAGPAQFAIMLVSALLLVATSAGTNNALLAPKLMIYLQLLCLVCLGLALAPAQFVLAKPRVSPTVSRTRTMLPVLLANLGVLLLVASGQWRGTTWPAAAEFCAVASAIVISTMLISPPLLQRLGPDVPAALRGIAATLLTAALAALALMGFSGYLS